MNTLIWPFLLFNLVVNAILGFLPVSPLLAFIGGGSSAFVLQKYSLSKLKQPINLKTQNLFLALSTVFSGLLLGYLFTLYFYITLQKPPQDDWFRFESYEHLVRESVKFRYQFFVFSSIVAGCSNFIGAWILFRLQIGAQKPTDETLLEKLPTEQFEKYLD